MKITNEFTVHTPIDRAWRVLTDLEGIAPCMPGAQLTGVEGDIYKGKVKVKVGPVISEFAGTARFAEKDEAGHRAVIDAKGRDARAGGNASALVTAVLTPDGESTKVSVDTDMKISGKLAQFGSGMIKEVSGKLLAQFVTNLEAKLATGQTAPEEAKLATGQTAPEEAKLATGQTAPEEAKLATGQTAPAEAKLATGQTAPEEAEPEPETAKAGRTDQVAPVSLTSDLVAPVLTDGEDAASDQPESDQAAADRNTPEPVAPVRDATPAPARAAAPVATEEPEPLDLLRVAGSSIYKRAIPVLVGVIVIGAVIAWAIARR